MLFIKYLNPALTKENEAITSIASLNNIFNVGLFISSLLLLLEKKIEILPSPHLVRPPVQTHMSSSTHHIVT